MNTRINKQQWQEEEALRRFQLISLRFSRLIPMMQTDPVKGKKIAEENHISVRSLYRYEKRFRKGSLQG